MLVLECPQGRAGSSSESSNSIRPVCGLFSGPVLAEGTLQGCAAVYGTPFILHSLNHMANVCVASGLKPHKPTTSHLFVFEDCLHPPLPLQLINKFSKVGNTLE